MIFKTKTIPSLVIRIQIILKWFVSLCFSAIADHHLVFRGITTSVFWKQEFVVFIWSLNYIIIICIYVYARVCSCMLIPCSRGILSSPQGAVDLRPCTNEKKILLRFAFRHSLGYRYEMTPLNVFMRCITCVAAHLLKDLAAEEIEECREAFNLFDSDADGHWLSRTLACDTITDAIYMHMHAVKLARRKHARKAHIIHVRTKSCVHRSDWWEGTQSGNPGHWLSCQVFTGPDGLCHHSLIEFCVCIYEMES